MTSSGVVEAVGIQMGRRPLTQPVDCLSGDEVAHPRYDVLGVSISAVNLRQTVDSMERWIGVGRKSYIVLTGVHGVIEMQGDDELRSINNHSDLTTPDGMPIVWLGRLRGYPHVEKTYGPDIMLEAFRISPRKNLRHFLYGGAQGVAERLKSRMEDRFPGLLITGTHCPPFRDLTPAEEIEIVSFINSAKPDVVWVGLGCPKQERWMARFRSRLEAPVLIGVGAAFDFLAGNAPLAPPWIKNSGFEWLFRLACEPRRLWPRYSRIVPKFLYLLSRERISRLSQRLFGRPPSL